MKNCFLFLCCLIVSICSFAQKDDDLVYFFKEDWSFAKDYDEAFYFMQVTMENDSTYIGRSYTKTGPMVKWETFKDKNIEMPHGKFAYYNSKGKLDSSGFVYNGKKDSTWVYRNAEGKFDVEEKYNKGKLVKRISYANKLITYSDGKTEPLKEEETKSPIQNDSTEKKKGKTFTVVQVPAEHKGGIGGWNKYLEKNLKTPERFITLHKRESSYKGTVIALFDINTEGKVDNIFIEQSCEWSTDTEVIRVLKASPKWKPALQNGRLVRYRHKQSLSFVTNSE